MLVQPGVGPYPRSIGLPIVSGLRLPHFPVLVKCTPIQRRFENGVPYHMVWRVESVDS